MHDLGRGNVTVQHKATGAAVLAFLECLRPDRTTGRARLRCAARIDQDDFGSGASSLEPDELNERALRGVMDGPGRHTFLEPGQIEIFKRDALVPRYQRA